MSWLYSRALVEEYLVDRYLDGEPFAQLNKTNTQLVFLPPDKMTKFSRLSRFGMTFAPLTESLGGELLTLFLAGSHAKTFQSQEKAQELKATEADCGKNLHGLLAKFDPNTCSLKTAQCSLFEEVSELFQTLPRSGILQNGCVYPLPIAERHISETDSGLWATPTTMDKLPPKSAEALYKEATKARPGRSKPANLRDQVSNMRNWPTPTKRDGKGAAKSRVKGHPRHNHNLDCAVELEHGEIVGRLNPQFVEWLMGWPQGWTDLAPLEMDKFQEWQQQHGAN